jgi:spermidine synthase
MVNLFRTQEFLTRLNQNSLRDAKVTVVNEDAFTWLRHAHRRFDLAVVDFPDPSNFSLGKLYSQTFYKTLRNALKPDGLVVVQSTSPYYAKNSFWCVVETLASAGFQTTPYHAYVPSFGDWGYVIGSLGSFRPAEADKYPADLKYVSSEGFRQMLTFPHDMKPTVHAVNKLNNQTLVHLFESEWSDYVEAH